MKATRYEQVADQILSLINNGVLKEGEKIPSLRQLSNELNVSVNTVKEAYWRLENENHIIAIPQSGFYVKRRPSESIEPSVPDPRHLDPNKISLCGIYGAFQNMGCHSPEVSMGIASLNPDFFPMERMGRFFQDAIRHQKYESYNYLMPPGYLPLREQIARAGVSSGLGLSPEEIIITNGCHEAVFLSLMILCKPGDTVVFESPIYFSLLHLLEQLNLKIIEIPSSPEGINLDTLRFVMENHQIKAMFSISNFNNPIGFTMASEKKKRLVRLLTEFNIPLIEDDIYGDLSFQERPDTCKTYDKQGNVILCSSFSKILSPGLRVGWIVPGKYYDQVLKMKMLLNISNASVNQIVVARFLKEGGYERHLRKLRKHLQEQMVALRASVLKYFPKGTSMTNPNGGLLLWVELPKEIDTYVVYQHALKKNILIAPGCLFTMKDKYSNCLRLNAGIWNEKVENAIQYLGQLGMGNWESGMENIRAAENIR